MLAYIRSSQATGLQAIHFILVYLPTPCSRIINFNFTLPVPKKPFQYYLLTQLFKHIIIPSPKLLAQHTVISN